MNELKQGTEIGDYVVLYPITNKEYTQTYCVADKNNWGLIKKEEGYIVLVVCYVFNCLRKVSLFQWIRDTNRCICGRFGKNAEKSFFGGHHFPELWVVCNMLCGIIMYILLLYVPVPRVIGWIFVVLAILRAFEIMVYHVNVLLFDPLTAHSKGQEYAIKSPTRMLVLLLCNMFEYVLCFSIVYLFCVEGMNTSFWQSFTMSISAFLNIDAPSATQNLLSNTWVAVARIESILGVFMNLICIARFINALPGVDTMNSKKA